MRHCPSPCFKPSSFLMGCSPERPCGSPARMVISSSRTFRSLTFLCDSFRNSRSNDGGGDNAESTVHRSRLLFRFAGFPAQLCQKCRGIPAFSTAVFPAAFADLRFEPWFLHFEVVFQLVRAQNARDGDSVFFQNKILAVHMRAPSYLSQIDACFGDGDATNNSSHALYSRIFLNVNQD